MHVGTVGEKRTDHCRLISIETARYGRGSQVGLATPCKAVRHIEARTKYRDFSVSDGDIHHWSRATYLGLKKSQAKNTLRRHVYHTFLMKLYSRLRRISQI